MKIQRLTFAVIEANYDWTVVRIDSDDGRFGLGEAYMGPGLTAILREMAPLLVGQDPFQVETLVRRLRAAVVHAGPGVAWHAIAGVEAALLDLIGKAVGQPVWRLLGGKYRDRVRVYADCHGGEALESISSLLVPRTPRWAARGEAAGAAVAFSVKHHGWDTAEGVMTPETYAASALRMVERGFDLLKFDVDVPTPYPTDEYNRGLSDREIEFMTGLIRAVREAVGWEVDLAVDCHWNYTVEDAVRLCRALDPLKLLWIEDPVPADDAARSGEVQKEAQTAIATGENHYFRRDFELLLDAAKLRILAPDPQKIGIWSGKKIADLADARYANLTLHNISGPIGTIASAHLAAAIPNSLALEWHGASVPFFDELLHGDPLIENGRIAMNERPGWGVELNEDVAYRYCNPEQGFFA
ncbi:MAG: mandelate racemase/muconate lactonizing enzyme family protein [Acidobacteria bacterium]|nr:mandelate racemase/muconate lactonizing enzyme family protein [Acidobacteriota bacterium]